MSSFWERILIGRRIKKKLSDPPGYKMSKEKKREFYAQLFDIKAEVEMRAIPKRRVFMKGLAGVTLSLFILVLMYNLFRPNYPYVSRIRGMVKVFRSARNEWVFVQDDKLRLHRDDMVKTFGDGQVDVIYRDEYHLRLKNNSEMKLVNVPSGVIGSDIKYSVNRGKVFAYYKRSQLYKRSLSLVTPQADVSVIGTDFMVETSPNFGSTWVGVLNGVVKVSAFDLKQAVMPKEMSVLVDAGKKTRVLSGRAPLQPERMLEDELFELEELYRIGTKPQIALLISTGETRTRELLSIVPLFVAADAKHKIAREIRKISEQFRYALKEGTKEQFLFNIRQFEHIVDRYPSPKYDVQFLLLIGAYYKYVNEGEKSIETFKRILRDYPRSRLASIAQCAIGIIYEEVLDDPAKARSAYEDVISKYPLSVEVEEAKAGLERLGL